MRKMKYVGLISTLLLGMFFCACSDHSEDQIWNNEAGFLLITPSLTSYEDSGSFLDGENDITDMQACLFEDGTMTQVFEDLQPTGGKYNLLVRNTGTLYMVANAKGLLDLDEMKGISEEEWQKTVLNTDHGKNIHFLRVN